MTTNNTKRIARSLAITLWWYDFASIWHDVAVHSRLVRQLAA